MSVEQAHVLSYKLLPNLWRKDVEEDTCLNVVQIKSSYS